MEQLKTEIDVLREVSAMLAHERRSDVLLGKVLDLLDRKMGMLRATFTLRQGDKFVIEASRGLSEEECSRGCYQLGEGVTGQVAATGIPEIIRDISTDRRFLNLTGARKQTKKVAFLCVPVFHNERVVGTLSIDRKPEPGISLDEDLQLLETIGNLVADAIATCQQEHDERRALVDENRRLREALGNEERPTTMIGNSSLMQEIYRLIHQVAPSDATVLVRGSSGTGKELVARAIQSLSKRVHRPFITLNCAALPEALVESELFGHERGAFTGATGQRIGRVEAADGGTLFLDEIGDLTVAVQVKLLRFLQERTFSRIGSNEELHTDVRLIAATSRNLEELMAQGKFREDLYYRLNIFPIVLPDLSARRTDILPLAEYFINKFNLRYGKKVIRISTPAINMLMAYHWPGNVRELENCIERAILTTTDDSIHGYNLPPSLQMSQQPLSEAYTEQTGQKSFAGMVDAFQRELIVEALKRRNGNMSAAARDLSLSPRVIHYNIRRLGIALELYKNAES